MATYRRKSQVIQATQWFPPSDKRNVPIECVVSMGRDLNYNREWFCVRILRGITVLCAGDWIIQDGDHIEVMAADKFDELYEPVT